MTRPVSNPAHRIDPLNHRRILASVGPFHAFRGTDVFTRIGGQHAVDVLVDGLYDRLGTDPGFGTLFARDLSGERARQKQFFAEWLGGERRYSDHAHAGLAHRHEELPITRAHAERWLSHFQSALQAAVACASDQAAIVTQATSLAMALVNCDTVPADRRPGAHGMCISGQAPVTTASHLAQRGDVDGLRELMHRIPDVLSRPSHASRVMFAASCAGRIDVVRWLIGVGVDVNTPFYFPVAIAGEALWGVLLATPLCAARHKRRGEVAKMLTQHGAQDDVFTAAFLGDLPELTRQLADHPQLVQASDPAVDVLDITPVHHAVAGDQVEALDVILGRCTEMVRGAAQALRTAANHGQQPIVERLVAIGADGRSIGPGRWVLHPHIAPLLARAGASASGSGSWIGLSCTGNQGRKDDPDYVHALLRHGASVGDLRGNRATALHFAAKAGFLRTIAVLLEHGADPQARDGDGLVPADWLARSVKSVDREAVRRLLGGR